MKVREIVEMVSPILVRPTFGSLTIGISKRFFLFHLMRRIITMIEEDPHLNFVAMLKSYKVLGRFLFGSLHEFHRDRNRLYFKNFFYDRKLWEIVKRDLESLHPKYKDVKMTITKRGVIIYDNYKKDAFNVLLLTIHSGTWVPEEIQKKMWISDHKRYREEDVETDRLYRNLVLEKAGIWIDNKQSRFVIDFNRALKNAIYVDNSEKWVNALWKEPLLKNESDAIYAGYREFYFALTRLLDSYQFNIILDGHSMKPTEGRPNLSFGTKYIPKFYQPIVRSMQRKMQSLGYSPVLLNTPFKGGFILRWLNGKFPNVFICSMEINKKIYMSRNNPLKRKMKKISSDLTNIFDIEIENEPSQQ